MQRPLSITQMMHRQFLDSKLWKEIRKKAFEFHGTNCFSCNEPASDIHHKTYKRFGGSELMEDLEPLCRNCHEAKHAIMKALGIRSPNKRVNLTSEVAYRYLSLSAKKAIMKEVGIETETELYCSFEKLPSAISMASKILNANIKIKKEKQYFPSKRKLEKYKKLKRAGLPIPNDMQEWHDLIYARQCVPKNWSPKKPINNHPSSDK